MEDIINTAQAANPTIDLATLGTLDRQPHFGISCAGAGTETSPKAANVWIKWPTLLDTRSRACGSTLLLLRTAIISWFLVVTLWHAPLRKLYAALKIGNTYRTFTAFDAHGSAVAMYIGADKSPKMVRQEVQLKRMLRIINERVPKN
ncbi:unnamed protein product [Prorocentrum cordatum]|uniref:Uncharacterized protein n=1 Tax=Prorocentrum cordatum TaxID=2364126 RepID=A0ABN9PRF7_9DINO|nr:unnamed protein product [Polarella glacialis]